MQFDFLICSERSGSNLITKIINAHSKICGPFPSHMIRYLGNNLFRYGDLKNDTNWETLLEDAIGLLVNGISTWKADIRKSMFDCPRRSVPSLSWFDASMNPKPRQTRRRGNFVKENHTHTILPYLLLNFPEAGFVYLVRDPRDMALTWKKATITAAGSLPDAARVWRDDQRGGIVSFTHLSSVGRAILVKFESLLTNSEKEVRRICEFLGVPYESAMLSFHAQDENLEKNSRRLESWSDLRRPLMKDNFGLYRAELDESEIRYIESICSEEMAFFGYERDFEDLSDPEALLPRLPLNDEKYKRRTDSERRILPAWRRQLRKIEERRLFRR